MEQVTVDIEYKGATDEVDSYLNEGQYGELSGLIWFVFIALWFWVFMRPGLYFRATEVIRLHSRFLTIDLPLSRRHPSSPFYFLRTHRGLLWGSPPLSKAPKGLSPLDRMETQQQLMNSTMIALAVVWERQHQGECSIRWVVLVYPGWDLQNCRKLDQRNVIVSYDSLAGSVGLAAQSESLGPLPSEASSCVVYPLIKYLYI